MRATLVIKRPLSQTLKIFKKTKIFKRWRSTDVLVVIQHHRVREVGIIIQREYDFNTLWRFFTPLYIYCFHCSVRWSELERLAGGKESILYTMQSIHRRGHGETDASTCDAHSNVALQNLYAVIFSFFFFFCEKLCVHYSLVVRKVSFFF